MNNNPRNVMGFTDPESGLVMRLIHDGIKYQVQANEDGEGEEWWVFSSEEGLDMLAQYVERSLVGGKL